MMAIDLNLLIFSPAAGWDRRGEEIGSGVQAALPARHQRMVEEGFMECRSAVRAKKLAEEPIKLPWDFSNPTVARLIWRCLNCWAFRMRKSARNFAMNFTAKPPLIFAKFALWKSRSRNNAPRPRAASSALTNLSPICGIRLRRRRIAAGSMVCRANRRRQNANHSRRPGEFAGCERHARRQHLFPRSGGGKAAVKPLALPSRAHAEIVFTRHSTVCMAGCRAGKRERRPGVKNEAHPASGGDC